MLRMMRLTIAGVVILSGLLGCVATQPTLPQLSASGYQIKVRVEPSQRIWLTPPESTLHRDFHGFGVVFVEVADAHGRLVDDAPVTFRLAPEWESSASISQRQTVTKNGQARMVFEPTTTGLALITIQVDDNMREATFFVDARAVLSCGGEFGGGMPNPRGAYY